MRRDHDPLGFVMAATRLGFASFLLGEVDRAVELCEEAISESNEHGEKWHKAEALGRSQHDRVATGRHPSGERAGCRRSTDPTRVRQRGGHRAVPRDPGLDRRHRASAPQGRATTRRGRRGLARDRRLPVPLPARLPRRDREDRRGERWGSGRSRPTTESASRPPHADNVAFALEEPEDSVVRAESDAVGVLTRREREIADLVASGMSNREIAAKLVISRRTAEGHVDHILGKLGLHVSGPDRRVGGRAPDRSDQSRS